MLRRGTGQSRDRWGNRLAWTLQAIVEEPKAALRDDTGFLILPLLIFQPRPPPQVPGGSALLRQVLQSHPLTDQQASCSMSGFLT